MKSPYPVNGISTHLVCDMWGCDLKLIEDEKFMKEVVKKAVKEASGNIIEIVSKKFQPQGHTVLALLAESHLSIHTWPEYDYVAIDVFTCGDNMNPHKSIKVITEMLKPEKVTQQDIRRGVLDV